MRVRSNSCCYRRLQESGSSKPGLNEQPRRPGPKRPRAHHVALLCNVGHCTTLPAERRAPLRGSTAHGRTDGRSPPPASNIQYGAVLQQPQPLLAPRNHPASSPGVQESTAACRCVHYNGGRVLLCDQRPTTRHTVKSATLGARELLRRSAGLMGPEPPRWMDAPQRQQCAAAASRRCRCRCRRCRSPPLRAPPASAPRELPPARAAGHGAGRTGAACDLPGRTGSPRGPERAVGGGAGGPRARARLCHSVGCSDRTQHTATATIWFGYGWLGVQPVLRNTLQQTNGATGRRVT
jgi:hypothetical protein